MLVLEYVPGETLADRLARGALPVLEAIDTAQQIAAALEAAHDRGVIHRDLKPGNVKITPEGQIKVLDFGLAKGATDGRLVGAQRAEAEESIPRIDVVIGWAEEARRRLGANR